MNDGLRGADYMATTGPPFSSRYFTGGRIPNVHGSLGARWHGDDDTFIWREDRWTGFGAKLTTAEERERDIRWKNEALHKLKLVDDCPCCGTVSPAGTPDPSKTTGPGAGGTRGL